MTSDEKMQGEGNYDADRRYRRGVRKTVSRTTEKEREERAESMSVEEQEAARKAEAAGKSRSHARPQQK